MADTHRDSNINSGLPHLSDGASPPIASLSQNHGSCLMVPLQAKLHDHKGDHKFYSAPITSISAVINLISFCQLAELICLEAVLFSGQHTPTFPVTMDRLWSPNDVVPSATELLSYPGSTYFRGHCWPWLRVSSLRLFLLQLQDKISHSLFQSPLPASQLLAKH
uniref:Tymovirus coat protein domain-containing protein n=1 Tax=Glossina austeni TaxID=7395 RepID=A0A1A9VAZ2_GLOAU